MVVQRWATPVVSHSNSIYIEREIDNEMIFFVEKQNQPLVAAMNNMQVAGRTIDKGASGELF
jgi:hypothetical protein